MHHIILELPERRVYLLFFLDGDWRTVPVMLGLDVARVAAGLKTTVQLDRRAD